MKKLVILIFLTFSFNSHSATIEENCNFIITFLQTIGFNVSSYRTFNPFSMPGWVNCGVTNTGNLIHYYTNPNRIFLFDEYSTNKGYCIQLTGAYEKTSSNSCY